MLTFDCCYTLFLIVCMTIFLAKEWLKPELAVFSTLMLLVIGGVISPREAFDGFSNHGMLTVAFLFVVAAALQRTGVLNVLNSLLFARRGRMPFRLLRFLTPVSVISAFFNNTPIVAMFIPTVRSWARKNDLALSKFMIPLSYASILGGTCTLIGTSTTLVVHGLMIQNGMPGLGFFEISSVSVPIAIIGLLVICFVAYRFLPNRKEPMLTFGENTREFVVEMKVEPDYRHIGQTVEQAGLRHLKGLYLFQIQRNGKTLAPLSRDVVIKLGDRLFFTGLPETIIELQRTLGLSLIKDHEFDLKNYDSDQLGAFEVVVSANSPLVGQNVRQSNFRSKYNAVILAVHRSGERIQRKIGDIVIKGGDTLLILADKDFSTKWYHSKDFYLVSKTESQPSKPRRYNYLAGGVFITMILAMATGALPVIVAVAAAAVIFMVSRTITVDDAYRNVEWGVLLVIASALGISKAMINSGLAEMIANGVVSSMSVFGVLGLLIGVYFITSVYTEIITNNAAAALVFPIALSVTQQAGIDPRPFFLAVALAASASFATPIGYQTNLMVYGPGGYKFKDFLKIGIPMNLFIGILAVTIIYLKFFNQ